MTKEPDFLANGDLNWRSPNIRAQALEWLDEKSHARGFVHGFILGFCVAAIVAIATAWSISAANAEEKKLTVRDAIGIWQVLVDPGFKEFKFNGATRMVFARYIAATFEAKKDYDQVMGEMRSEMAGGPGKDMPKDKVDQFMKSGDDMLEADSHLTLPKIDQKELCLDPTPESCSLTPPVKNEIPPAMLVALLPILK